MVELGVQIMKNALRKILAIFVLLIFTNLVFATKSSAITAPANCKQSISGITIDASTGTKQLIPDSVSNGNSKYTYSVCGNFDYLNPSGKSANLRVSKGLIIDSVSPTNPLIYNDVTGCFVGTFTWLNVKGENFKFEVTLPKANPSASAESCDPAEASLAPGTAEDRQKWDALLATFCNGLIFPSKNIKVNSPFDVGFNFPTGTQPDIQDYAGTFFSTLYTVTAGQSELDKDTFHAPQNTVHINSSQPNTYRFDISITNLNTYETKLVCSRQLKVCDLKDTTCIGESSTTLDTTNAPPPFELCKQVNKADEEACNACRVGSASPNGSPGLWTSVGCIPTNFQGIIQSLLSIGLGISGGFVVITVLMGAFKFATSAGQPKQIQEAQETISAAVIGLLFVIFSIIILKFIGVSLLHIPGFAN